MGTAGPLRSGPGRARLFPLAPLHLLGLACLQAALVLACFEPLWSLWPLGALLVMVGLAPFFPRWRLLMPVLSHSRTSPGVLLSFDDGPDPQSTPALLSLLDKHGAKAVFFLVGRKAEAQPELLRAMLQAGHSLGNHSWDHDPWLMFRSARKLAESIDRTQEALAQQGFRPRLFRPPAWVVGPRLWPVLLRRGMDCMVASCRALDWGNRRIDGLARRMLRKARPGRILALHDRPPPGRPLERWLAEVDELLAGLVRRELPVLRPEVFFGRSLSADALDPVAGFYDRLAATYDQELEAPGQSRLRRQEQARVLTVLDSLPRPDHGRALDWGAGTGRFSLPLLERGWRVLALDRSEAMLERLAAKAAGLEGIEMRRGELGDLEDSGFELILAASVLEYVEDLDWALSTAARLLAPGGHLLLTTAHPSCWRFFPQLGNAMRQGLWLFSRRRKELFRSLERAGLEAVALETWGLPDPFGRPLQILILARPRADLPLKMANTPKTQAFGDRA